MADPSVIDGTFLILQEPATWWDGFLQILQAGSIIGAAWMAIWGISAWRREMIGRKKADLAENVLAAFFEAQDIFISARHPFAFGNEGRSRPRDDNENDDDAHHLDSFYVPIERIEKHNEFFAKLEASKYRFMTLFGSEAVLPFHEIRGVRNEIVSAAVSLIRRHKALRGRDQFPERDQNRIRELEEIIWSVGQDDDPLKNRIENAVSSIEQTCRPILTDRPYPFSQCIPSWLRRGQDGTAR